MTQGRRSRRTIAKAISALVAVTAASIIVVVPASLPPSSSNPFTVKASAAGCLDDKGNPVTCPISLAPTPLPVGKTLGEQELSGLFGNADGRATVQPYEFKSGSTIGHCLPRNAACGLTNEMRVGTPLPAPGDEVPSDALVGPQQGDAAITSGDMDGDGRDETIAAARCPSGTTGADPSEICIAVYDPASNAYPGPKSRWFPTGTFADGQGMGRIALKSGLLLRSSATIIGATFVASDGTDPTTGLPSARGGVIATFTTNEPHGFIPGQPVRFDDDPALAEAMCPALSEGSVLCGTDLSADWMPVLDVPTPDTFTMKIGLAFDEGGTAAQGGDTDGVGPTIPGPWPARATLGQLESPMAIGAVKLQVLETGDQPAVPFKIFIDNESMTVVKRAQLGGNAYLYTVSVPAAVAHDAGGTVFGSCTTATCSLNTTGVRPGVAMAWDAPGHVATMATFAVRPDQRRSVRLLDSAPIGRLSTNATSAQADGATPAAVPGRDALDLAIADFDGDGQDEIATAWAGMTTSAPVAPMGMVRFFAVSEAKQLVPLTNQTPWDATNAKAPYFVSMASGYLAATTRANTAGQDLVIAWGGQGHAFEIFDVSRSFGIRSSALDDSGKDDVLLDGDGTPAEWTPGTTYQAGQVIRDDLGFWRAGTSGVASCQQDVPEASKFYFPDTPAATLKNLPVPAAGPGPAWDATANRLEATTFEPLGTKNTPLAGPLRGILDPGPASPTNALIPAYTAAMGANASRNVLHGQFVSPALAAQTLDGAALRMYMGGLVDSEFDFAAFPQLLVRVVSNDGSTTRGVMLSTLGAGLPANVHRLSTMTLWEDPSGKLFKAGQTRRFPATDEVFTPTQTVQLEQGDRLVVEYGTRIVTSSNATTPVVALQSGTPGSQDLPIDETTRTGGLNPFIEFTKKVKLDNCADHLADVSDIDWQPVDASTMVSTNGPAGDNVDEYGRSIVRVDAGDFDMDGLDEVVVAETNPSADFINNFPNPVVPVRVSIWRGSDANCQDQASPAAAKACPSKQGSPDRILFSNTYDAKVGTAIVPSTQPVQAGAEPIAQLSMHVGRVGAGVTRPSFPNDVNPDVAVAFTCTTTAVACGGLSTSPVQPGGPATGAAVVTGAFDVCVVGTDQDGDGNDDICPTPAGHQDVPWSLTGQRFAVANRRALPTSGPGREWTTTAFALPDVDLDSKTLGSPVEYLETGHVQPLMILRSPPVHFDAFDTSTNGEPGTPPDGKIDPSETWDVNNCFADYLATGEDYVCHTTSSYGSSTTVTSTLSGEVSNAGTTAGSGQLSASVGVGNSGCVREDGAVHVDEPDAGPTGVAGVGFCVEGSAFLKLRGSQEQSASVAQTVGRAFTYTSTVTTAAGADAVYAAVQQNMILEYPVYAGAGFGFGAGDPIEFVTSKTPLRTRFQWTSSEDYSVPLTGGGLVPQNIVSYARSEDQLKNDAPKYDLLSATPKAGNTWVEADMKDAPSLDCALNNDADPVDAEPLKIRGTDAWSYLDDSDDKGFGAYPCAAGDVGVQVLDTKGPLDRSYIVTQILSATKLRLEPTTPLPGSGVAAATKGSLYISPGSFPVDEWTVQRFHKLETELVTNTDSGFEKSYGWGFGAGLDAGVAVNAAFTGGPLLGEVLGGVGLEFNFSTDYTHNELQTMNVGTTQETRFAIEVTGNIKPDIRYTIKPYLMQSPNGAMVLDWTTSPDVLDTFWHSFYFDAGPNPAFALPNLLTPYKSPDPNSKPAATTPTLLRSPDFGGWNCDKVVDPDTKLISYTNCIPNGSAEVGKPLWLVSTVHNYSLKTYDRSTPLKIRFYVGDPARGGYQIAESDVPTVRSNQCINRFCLPAQGSSTVRVPWEWKKSYPGLAGRGRPTEPLPIYAIIDPGNQLKTEVHDFTAPVEVRECAANYPFIPTDEPFNSSCPTTDNEGWFLQGFDGARQGVTDISVAQPNDLRLNGNGTVSVTVHAAADTGRVQVRLFRCPSGVPTCLPQTNAVPLGVQTIGAIPAGGQGTSTFSPGLTTGAWTLWAQVVSVDNWEPVGGGPFDVTGALRNNQVAQIVTAP